MLLLPRCPFVVTVIRAYKQRLIIATNDFTPLVLYWYSIIIPEPDWVRSVSRSRDETSWTRLICALFINDAKLERPVATHRVK